VAPSASLLKLLKEVKGDVGQINLRVLQLSFSIMLNGRYSLAQLTDLPCAVQLKPQFVNTVIWCFQLNEFYTFVR